MTTPAPPQTLVVSVPGRPAPQGSKNYVGHRAGKPVLVESCRTLPSWRNTVVLTVKSMMNRTGFCMITGPAAVTLDFYIRRSASAPKSRLLPDRRADADKLARGVLDSLTLAGAVEDDARVVQLIARKHYHASWSGVRIELTAVTYAELRTPNPWGGAPPTGFDCVGGLADWEHQEEETAEEGDS